MRGRTGVAVPQVAAAAEELVRDSGLAFTILKAGVIYGRGDRLSRAMQTLRVFATARFREKPTQATGLNALSVTQSTSFRTADKCCVHHRVRQACASQYCSPGIRTPTFQAVQYRQAPT